MITRCMVPSRSPTPCLPLPVPYANLGLKPRQYDPQKAKALLEKAGWTLPAGKDIREKNGQPLRIELSFIGTDALKQIDGGNHSG